MSGWKAKRFWTVATAEPCDGGFTVRLDGRAVKTPAKAPVVMPSHAMAEAVARDASSRLARAVAAGEELSPLLVAREAEAGDHVSMDLILDAARWLAEAR